MGAVRGVDLARRSSSSGGAGSSLPARLPWAPDGEGSGKSEAGAAGAGPGGGKPSRKQRKHASGGNPNQDLFFSRLRRKQKWVFLVLAIVFALSFAALGVGSGNGGGLEQMFSGILGSGSDPVAKAKGEIKTNPAKGYKDLANAYVTKNDLTDAITAMQSYLQIKKTDSAAWTQLGGYEKQQGDTASTQYQQVLQTTRAPGSRHDLPADRRARDAARDESDRPVLHPAEPAAVGAALPEGDHRLQRLADGLPERREVRAARQQAGRGARRLRAPRSSSATERRALTALQQLRQARPALAEPQADRGAVQAVRRLVRAEATKPKHK